MAFSAYFSPEIPSLLKKLKISLILTTYQAGKVIVLSSDGAQVRQLLRDFDRPMGIGIHGDMMALALRMNVAIFRNDRDLARTYPKVPDTYDGLFFPLALNKTDFIDTHDISFTEHGLVAVNTAYSCLVKVDGTFSFQPIWQPSFIKEFSSGDCCHLNGMAVDQKGKIRYVTAFGDTAIPEGWRTNKLNGGIIIDIATGEIVANRLGMPHSPRIYQDKLYFLSSATEELLCFDPASREIVPIIRLDGFLRGLSFKGDLAFIGTSKLRKSHTFGDLPIARKQIQAGVFVVNIRTGEIAGEIRYEDDLEEIYDVHVLHGMQRPNILNLPMSEQFRAMITPEGAQWVPTERNNN